MNIHIYANHYANNLGIDANILIIMSGLKQHCYSVSGHICD